MKNIKYYINVFLIYAILGFIVETLIKKFFFPKMQNGSLHGPWIPIYGIGCVSIIILIKLINIFKCTDYIKNTILFILSMVILSLLEYIGGYLLRKNYWKNILEI